MVHYFAEEVFGDKSPGVRNRAHFRRKSLPLVRRLTKASRLRPTPTLNPLQSLALLEGGPRRYEAGPLPSCHTHTP